ncbi:glycoside hydrolase family 27 protein [Rhodanobacter sp. PCA2]|uniref:glycoside hydrolase family 27 protein n=1 Tax=Rhodanobacter sp. PCA2 TaxID=2006117 RepID=UPI0015E6FAE4|nr:glycoside hydrolase family 27 protein [Rhodanobacter sp. PCA2]MBA2079246.1 alpha-galactosidase [Rhodanobacter sp. PCA2]
MRLYRTALLAASLLACSTAMATAPQAHAATVAATPPMGWNSWNFFAEKVSDADVRAAADALVNSGMRDAGYVYVNIDDGWQGERDAQGTIHPNARFPDMKALADYVHARGLKLGIYSSPGSKTCAGYTGSLGHEAQDARTYASWGVDYLKYDLCSYIEDVMQAKAPNDPDQQMRLMIAAYRTMHDALRTAGRPIVFSMCQYGWDASWEWAAGPDIGANLWRTTGDITPEWDRIYAIASQQAGLARYAGPGHWNDPDMLEVGNGKLNDAENRAHFSWWAMLAAPLLAGNDLAHMPAPVKAVLTNKAVIAIDQDPLGRQATRAYAEGETEVWTRPLQGGGMAVAIFNVGSDRHAGTHPFHLDLARLGLHGAQQGTDLWSGKPLTLSEHMPIALRHHDVLMVRIDQPH